MDTKFATCDLVLEMKLHPIYKNTQESLNRVVIMCCRQHGIPGRHAVERLREVDDKIRSTLLSLLKSVVESLEAVEEQSYHPAHTQNLISKADRVLIAVPSSSCQLERDFSVSGEMVSPQHTNLAGDSFDICIFLNRNPGFVNWLQCEETPKGQHNSYARPSLEFGIDIDSYLDDLDSDILAEFVSSTTLSSEFLDDDEEKSSL
ncbi:unnamed protein product [Phytophthora fragariaefolia]|uniref:Unnamed protein product n=1 Tax=Phytophthora fragariaefolia TaxID=1490495 RepID=A0A9W6Y3X7_9STRA|nr:unnamed protein product [Phytophthora fragariaefolia]